MMVLFGVDPIKTINTIRGLVPFYRDLKSIKMQREVSKNPFPWGKIYPCLEDRSTESGNVKGHYFYQDLLVAQKIFAHNPKLHIDVGSRIDGFVAHVASFRQIKVLDIRLMTKRIHNITYECCDITGDIPPELYESCDSLSCLHALEHFGLGRYGDPVNYDGHLVGFNNLYKILKHSGVFYLSVPIGPLRVEFNGCRAFSLNYLLSIFEGKFHVESFSFVDDNGYLFENVKVSEENVVSNFGCNFGCGIFVLRKL